MKPLQQRQIEKILQALALILILSNCIVPRYADVGYYERELSRCPEYPEAIHYRAVGKGFDPECCNFIH